MKINSIEIENYKSFAPASAKGFANNNIVFGYNNSGKSNLINFLHLIFSKKTDLVRVQMDDGDKSAVNLKKGAANFWQGKIVNMPFIYFKGNSKNIISFKVSVEVKNSELPHIEILNQEGFLNSSGSTSIDIDGTIVSDDISNSHLELKEVHLNKKKIFSIDGSGTTKYFESTTNQDLTHEAIFTGVLSILNDGILLIDSNRFFRSDTFIQGDELNPANFKDWLFRLYLNASTYKDFETLKESLNKFEIGNNDDLALKDNLANYPFINTEIGFTKNGDDSLEIMLSNKSGRYPISNYGTGVQQIIYFLTKLFISKSKIVLIEEFELNLSPHYQNEFLKFIQGLIDSNIIDQLFFTSHSNYLVDHPCISGFYSVKISSDGKSTIDQLNHGAAKDFFVKQFVPIK